MFQNGGITDEVLQDRVYEQWLDSNLEDMDSFCLPRNLAQERLQVLSGRFGLQVSCNYDILGTALSFTQYIPNNRDYAR